MLPDEEVVKVDPLQLNDKPLVDVPEEVYSLPSR
jgi:hypothetical protein